MIKPEHAFDHYGQRFAVIEALVERDGIFEIASLAHYFEVHPNQMGRVVRRYRDLYPKQLEYTRNGLSRGFIRKSTYRRKVLKADTDAANFLVLFSILQGKDL